MNAPSPLRILLVGTLESGGGAAAIASGLHRGYQARGHVSWRAVGQKVSDDPGVFMIPDDDRPLFRTLGYTALQTNLRRKAGRNPGKGWGLVRRTLRQLTHPRVWLQEQRGIEDFEFPGSHHVLDLLPGTPDVVHCHNLHGGYFDLRALPELSRRVPMLVTLHDAWMLSGHCAHSIGCEKWKAGCGACPDLRLYPAIRRDGTAENWDRKRDIYARSRLHVATPSQWLADRVQQSILAAAVTDLRVIPNGVDLSIFHPADRMTVRHDLGLPPDAFVILLTAGSHYSVWKDRRTLDKAMTAIVERGAGSRIVFVALEDPGGQAFSNAPNVRYAGYQSDPATLAKYHQAADVYVHAARADTFPTAVLEALACGTPVVATRVGGIPEQIITTDAERLKAGECASTSTGALVAPSDPLELAEAVLALMTHAHIRIAMGDRAARDARQRFDETRVVDDHLRWYQDVRENWH